MDKAKTHDCHNSHQQCLNETIVSFKDSLLFMQNKLEAIHCDIDNFFSNSNRVLSDLMSDVRELENKLRTCEADLNTQENNKAVADKINTIDSVTIKLSQEINVILSKMQSDSYCITDEELSSLEAQYEYLLQIRGEVEAANKDISADLVQQKFTQMQRNKPIYDEIALQINNAVNKHRTNKYAVEVISNISKLTQDINAEVDLIINQNQGITYEEIQNNIDVLIRKQEILVENKKYLDEVEFEISLDQLARDRSDLFGYIDAVNDKIVLGINKLTNFAQMEAEWSDLINNTNNSLDELIIYIDKAGKKINNHEYESIEQKQEEFDYLMRQIELLNQQISSFNDYVSLSSDHAIQTKHQVLQKFADVEKNSEILLQVFQYELQKTYHAQNVINNFREFLFSLEKEIDLICFKIKNNHYISVNDGINELISKQQDMHDRQIELNSLKESLIPADLLKKKIETLRKFIDIQEKISHFLLDIKIFNAM